MAAFPKLRSGAIAQYPSSRQIQFATEVHRFLDSGEQRYRDAGKVRRRWRLELSQLDDGELAQLKGLFEEVSGAAGTFEFVDPATGMAVGPCRFDLDQFESVSEAEFDSKVTLNIVEAE